ncbi:Ulp1 family isopeptidase [Bradyrhizobium genomosp. I (2014)]|uniref:Ulp1 family isopeptidase n=1 Tax=Bradyrhizobium genomosp. I (2014) TaxID=2683269 RepID=UPI0004B230BF|nr:Ulp1 family isopeptidase [Bradyrhizobium sp. CCBAU 43298]
MTPTSFRLAAEPSNAGDVSSQVQAHAISAPGSSSSKVSTHEIRLNESGGQQTDSVDAQDASPADSSAEAAAFQRQLSEVAVLSAPVLMQVRAYQADASRSEARPIVRASGQPYTPAPHGEGGGTTLNASALPLGHANLVFAGSGMDPVYSDDASLIEGLGPALFKAGATERTVRRNVRCLLGLGHWLVKNGKPGIAARLSEESLVEDALEFGKQEGQAIATPLVHLRASQSPGGIAPIASRVELNPYSQDADLIKGYKEDAASGTANTVRKYATLLIDFSDYLRENDKPGIAARLGDGSLDNDVSQYKEADPRGRRKAGAALAHLLRSPAGARAIELRPHIRPVPDFEGAVRAEPSRTRAATAQHSSSGAISWPETLPANQQDLLLETMDGPSSSPPIETIAHHQQAADAGGSFRDLNLPRADHGVSPPHGLALDAAGSLNWRHHDDELTDKRHRNPLGPGEQVLVINEHDIGELRSAKRQKTLSNPQGVAVERQLMQTPSHQLAASPLQMQAPMLSQNELIGEPLPGEDAELLARFRVDAKRRKLTPGAINNSVSGLGRFVRWVNAEHGGSVASRLRKGTPLDEEIAAYRRLGRDPQHRITSALDVLRRLLRGGEEAEAPEPRVLGAPRRLVPHPEDAPLIEGALSQALKHVKTAKDKGSAQKRATRLRALSAWLKGNRKGSIIGRLNGSSKEQLTLDNDVLAFQRTGGARYRPDLSHLRSYLKLIEANRELGLPGPEQPSSPAAWGDRHPGSAQDLPSTPASPSAGAWVWLGEQLHEPASPSRPPSHAKGRLEPSVDLNAPTPSELRDDAHFAPAHPARARSDTYAGLEPFVDLNAPTPSELRDDAHFAPAHPARARSDTYAGLEPFVDLNAPTPSELRDDAHFAPAHPARARSDTYAGLEAAVNPNPRTPFELRDNAWAPAPDFRPLFAGPVPGHHQGARQPGSPQGLSPAPAFSDDEALAWLREELARRQMQEPASPSTGRAPSDIYGGLESLVHLDAPTPWELRDDAHFAPAPAARARSDTYRGFPLVDLTAPTPSESRDDANSVRPFPITSANAQIGALDPTVSSHGHGLVLEDTEWLGDEHIDRDYRLQEQDLQRNDPDLAARTRFVNPLIVLNYLGSNDDGVVQTEFQRIVHDDEFNDTADFLFLPVINANPEDPNNLGNHWSLLFVDRSDRGQPVAYHYDSYRGLNKKHAEHLASRLHLRLEPAGMAQQQNTYDCGVFVVDGTRALVRQLEQGGQTVHLDQLVVDRQALQNRLRG